jgi:cellulose synthase/poly-beta-1,6-N-acetylglucosamine synthase-like glycosyltransferase
MPVHNEEVMLRFSLPSIYDLNPDEVILILDKCTDNSKNITKKISKFYHKNKITKVVEINEDSSDWKKSTPFIPIR